MIENLNFKGPITVKMDGEDINDYSATVMVDMPILTEEKANSNPYLTVFGIKKNAEGKYRVYGGAIDSSNNRIYNGQNIIMGEIPIVLKNEINPTENPTSGDENTPHLNTLILKTFPFNNGIFAVSTGSKSTASFFRIYKSADEENKFNTDKII